MVDAVKSFPAPNPGSIPALEDVDSFAQWAKQATQFRRTNVSQTDLGRIAGGYSKSFVNQWINDPDKKRPDEAAIARICAYFGLSALKMYSMVWPDKLRVLTMDSFEGPATISVSEQFKERWEKLADEGKKALFEMAAHVAQKDGK